MIRHMRARSPVRPCSAARLLWGLLAVFTPSALAVPVRALATSQEVGATLLAATSEVMLLTPSLRSKEVAEGLRKAAAERGVHVFLLADVRYLNDGGSYLNGLSMTPGIQVRLLRGVGEASATIDRKSTLKGPLLSDIASPLQQTPTAASQEPLEVRSAAAWFSKAWTQARPYRYKVPDLAPRKPVPSTRR